MSTTVEQSRDTARSVAAATTPDVPRPAGAPPATLPALVVGVLAVALGAAAVRDAVVTLGWAAGDPWAPGVLRALEDGVRPSVALVVAGVVLALVGLWFLGRAVARRPRRDLGLGGGSHAWIAPSQVCRVASLVAGDVDGVVSARCRPGRRSVAVRVVATPAAGGQVRNDVRDRVVQALEGLEPTPRVTVRVSTLGGAR